MKLIDTHCHLCHGRLRNQLADVLARARSAGVTAFICATSTLAESTAALSVARENDDVFCTAGVHPHDAAEVPPDYLDRLEQLAAEPKNVAIGEIGLDYHYNYSPPADQRKVFAAQLALACRLGKPAVIHTREAFEDTLAIIDEAAALPPIVLHSFTGNRAQAEQALELGAMISFSGIVTFKTADDLREAAKIIPDDKLLVETDSPFLSPEPVRKIKTNEPAHVGHVVTFLANLRNTSPEALAQTTSDNAERFFCFSRGI